MSELCPRRRHCVTGAGAIERGLSMTEDGVDGAQADDEDDELPPDSGVGSENRTSG